MRLTIKYLQEKLERAEQDRDYYYNSWKELKEKEDNRMYEFNIRDSERVESLRNENHRLMQIIRILAKDETLALEIKMRDEIMYSGLK